jgi:hypothetical protein
MRRLVSQRRSLASDNHTTAIDQIAAPRQLSSRVNEELPPLLRDAKCHWRLPIEPRIRALSLIGRDLAIEVIAWRRIARSGSLEAIDAVRWML